jgi:hypothetical protein
VKKREESRRCDRKVYKQTWEALYSLSDKPHLPALSSTYIVDNCTSDHRIEHSNDNRI